jgi:dethiobiotin synthetase
MRAPDRPAPDKLRCPDLARARAGVDGDAVWLIITGTGTGVGKTVVTAAMAACASEEVAVVKPAQTGVGPDDAGDLAEVARLSGVRDLHEFVRYAAPLSPERAAARAGIAPLGLDDVVRRVVSLDRELVLIEGAGGLLVRYADDGWTIADLACQLGAPAVVVTTAALGTLNATALTLEAMARRGIELAGLVIGSWPAVPGLAERCNVADLQTIAGAPLAGALPEGLPRMADFARHARACLAPRFGGTFERLEPDAVTYCDRCGRPGVHDACLAARTLEPPRYCPHCGRRMVVQVTPTGWTARCVEHGERNSFD